MTEEETRLNEMGWEISGTIINRNGSHTDRNGVTYYGKMFAPCKDLNDTALVEQAMVEKGWDYTVMSTKAEEQVKTVACFFSKPKHPTAVAEAPLDQKALAIMRAIEKAVESEGKG